jgi:hypothetical protein
MEREHVCNETESGARYCVGCSQRAYEWVSWPCPAVEDGDALGRIRAVFEESAAHPGMHDPHSVILQIRRILDHA